MDSKNQGNSNENQKSNTDTPNQAFPNQPQMNMDPLAGINLTGLGNLGGIDLNALGMGGLDPNLMNLTN